MKYLILALVAVSTLVSCSENGEDPIPVDPINAQNIGFSVDYYEVFSNTIYPSMILGLREHADEIDLFAVNITNADTKDRSVMVSIDANDLIEATTHTFTMKPGENVFDFSPNWDYESLKFLDQPGSINLAYSVVLDGEQVTTFNKSISYRSIGECVFGFQDTDEFVDMKFMFAAYVNEDNPKIDEFLSESIAYGIVSDYKGYQGSPEEVRAEVFSIWYHLQKNNTKYSNITSTSNPSSTVFSQNVRFFDQVFQNSSANCVDGSVFISSILLKLGIEPVIVLVPGHMYMGFYAASNKQELTLLETTAVGGVSINSIQDSQDIQPYADDGYFTSGQIDYYNSTCNNGECDVEYMRRIISYTKFLLAMDTNVDSFNSSISKFNDPDNHVYQVFDIKELRKLVSPIGR